jgi:hypothetical protein
MMARHEASVVPVDEVVIAFVSYDLLAVTNQERGRSVTLLLAPV